MRILFSTTPLDGHFRPLLPLARSLRARGNKVAFATAASWREFVEAEGFEALAAGADHRTARGARFDAKRAEVEALRPLDRRQYVFAYLFAEGHAPLKLPELLETARAWRAEAIVYESGDLAAPIAASALELPSVHHAFGTMVSLAILERAGAAVAPLWRQMGLEPAAHAGAFRGLHVDIVPPALDGDRPLGKSIRLRPTLDSAGVRPPWLDELRRPLVYATMGTVFNRPDVFAPLLDALGRAPVGALVTVGRDVDPAALGAIPPNVWVERFVPQAQVLPSCAAVVSHGGSGTILGALAAGVPLVLLPQGADQFENAARCVRAGVALELQPERATAETIASALEAVRTEPSYAEAARRIQEEIAAMQPAEQVALAVEEHMAAG